MPVTILCPTLKCRAILQVPDKARGKKVRCSQCGTAFLVPVKKEAPRHKPASVPPSPEKATPESS